MSSRSVCRETAGLLDSVPRGATITHMYRVLSLVVFCLASSLCLGANDAERLQRAGIEPVVSPSVFKAFMADLQLGQDEMDAAEVLLDDYAVGMRTVLDALRAQQERDRERLDAALDGRIRLTIDQIRELRMSLRRAVQDAWVVADQQLMEMVEWGTLLSQADAATQARAVGQFHRRVYLTGHGRAGLVDVADLVSEAAHEELAGIDEASVHAALSTYRRAIADVAKADAIAVRGSRITDAMAELQGDSASRVSLQRDAATRWQARMTLQDAATTAVATLLAASDSDAVDRWMDRVNASFFPSVCAPLEAVLAAKWIAKNGDRGQATASRSCLDASVDAIRSLQQEAIMLLREGRRLGVDLDHDAASLIREALNVRMRYLRNSGERSVLEATLFDCVMRSLSDGQKAAVRRILAVGH